MKERHGFHGCFQSVKSVEFVAFFQNGPMKRKIRSPDSPSARNTR